MTDTPPQLPARTPEDPFELTPTEAAEQVGNLEPLYDLQRWLLPQEPVPVIRYRYAQSVVARTEAELFGLSIPRFAVRAYVDGKECGSFVNLRRIEQFRLRARDWAARIARPGRQA